jgi:hypothetical protein
MSGASAPGIVVVAPTFIVFGQTPWAPDGRVEDCLSTSKNKGGLTLLFFEHQDVGLFHVGVLDLAADEFRSFSRRFPQFGVGRFWISRVESMRSCGTLSLARVALFGRDAKLRLLVGAMGHVLI